ncbi:hypothetical protein LEMLEM_LOCUS9953 [Lemmus lemmus]
MVPTPAVDLKGFGPALVTAGGEGGLSPSEECMEWTRGPCGLRASVVPQLDLAGTSEAVFGPAAGAHRTAQEGVKVARSSRPTAAGSRQPRGFRRERARRNPGRSPGRWERSQTPPGTGASGIGSAGGQPGSQLPLGSPSPRSQSASQPGSLSVCSVIPCRDVRDFLLGRNQWSSACPAQMPPNPKRGLRPRDPGGRDSCSIRSAALQGTSGSCLASQARLCLQRSEGSGALLQEHSLMLLHSLGPSYQHPEPPAASSRKA